MESLLELNEQLNDLGYTLQPFKQEDEDQLYEIFRHVVDTGGQFPYECSSKKEFHRQFLKAESHVYVCHSADNEVIGGFYIRPNFSDRSRHIANAAYMVREDYRGQGIGILLIKASLHLAKELGFHAMQFNRVFSQNNSAFRLYQKVGFKTIGTIPKAILNADKTYQDGYIMYRSLEDI